MTQVLCEGLLRVALCLSTVSLEIQTDLTLGRKTERACLTLCLKRKPVLLTCEYRSTENLLAKTVHDLIQV